MALCVEHAVAWERLKPRFVELAKKSQKTRLEREKIERRRAREKTVALQYRTILERVASSTVSFMPTLSELLLLPRVCAAIADDQDVSEQLHKTVAEAITVSLPAISESITARASAYRAVIPASWPQARADQGLSVPSTKPSKSTIRDVLDLHSQIIGLDLAAYVFSCGRTVGSNFCEVRTHFGLDVIAHSCPLSRMVGHTFQPLREEHRAVLRILKSLKLDAASTTVSELDDLDPAFVDTREPPQAWRGRAYKLVTWREAVHRFFTSFH